jgi:hypothetical protein
MKLFIEWLLFNESVDINTDIIKNYANRLITHGHDGIHLDDYKTLLKISEKYINRMPSDNQLNAFEEIASAIKEVMNLVKGEEPENLKHLFISTFSDIPTIERKMILKGWKEPNQLQYEDIIEDAIEGLVNLRDLERVLRKNINKFKLVDKDKRKKLYLYILPIINRNLPESQTALRISGILSQGINPDFEELE